MDSNRLIAEFMGAEGHPKYNPTEWDVYITGCLDVDSDNENAQHFFTPDQMKYHTSWNWLMPVIEKIETLGYSFEKNYQPIEEDWQSLIVKGEDILYQEFDPESIKASYYVVCKLITDIIKT